jgi:hemolysin III
MLLGAGAFLVCLIRPFLPLPCVSVQAVAVDPASALMIAAQGAETAARDLLRNDRPMTDRAQTLREEIANAVSHGAGLVMGIVALPLLVMAAARRNDGWQIVASAIYATTLVLLYGASTLYHAIPARSRAKRVLRALDHGAIYLLIAGTYTPFALGALRGAWGWTLLAIIWGLAAAGIALKAGVGYRYPRLSTAVYLLMGWIAVVALHPLYMALGPVGLGWLLAGGASYSLGVFFFANDGLRYRHFVWHLFVLAGSACHLVAVAGYAHGIAR